LDDPSDPEDGDDGDVVEAVTPLQTDSIVAAIPYELNQFDQD
jgi:hypothetical protein